MKSQLLRDLFKSDWRGLAVVAAITIGYNGVSYIFKTFSLSYLVEFRSVTANVGAFGITLAGVFALITVPIVGRLCDRFDARPVMLLGAASTAAIAFPFFWLLDTGRPVYIWVALIMTVGIVVPAMLAASGSFLARQFPAEVRASGLGAGREISGAVAGGLAPLAALTVVTMSSTHATWGVSLLFVIGALFLAVGSLSDQGRKVSGRDRKGVRSVAEELGAHPPMPTDSSWPVVSGSSRTLPHDERAQLS